MSSIFFIEFSRENQEAANYELVSIANSSRKFSVDRLHEEYALVTGDVELIKNCAFVNSVSEVLKEADTPEDLGGTELPEGSFYLRVRDFNGCHNSDIEPVIGRLVGEGRKVTFKNADFRIRALHADKWYLALNVHEKDKKGMEARRAPLRPFFSPVAIHPRYARYLVNITETLPGDVILDPFCGTGGILLEAGLTGRTIIGNDVELNMVKGARLNLKYFNLKGYRIFNKDIAELELEKNVDGIATDLPYGRNSNMKAESIKRLYAMAFLKFHQWLKPGGIAAVIVSDTTLLDFASPYFHIGKVVGVPQHKSLTRYFVSMRRRE